MRILITGGSGFLGSNLVRMAAEQHEAEVLATHHRPLPEKGPELPCRWLTVDLLDSDRLLRQVEEARPDAIIHAAILNDLPLMYQDRRLAWNTYVGATQAVVEAGNRTGAQVVLVSTDWVFDGTQAGADEKTPPNPINLYGVLKLVCETIVLETARDGAVARVAGVNGVHWARPEATLGQNAGFGYLVTDLLRTLVADRPFSVWESDRINMLATPSLASECAEMILRVVERDLHGTFHCVGGEQVSRKELALAAAETFDLDVGLVVSGPPRLTETEKGLPFPLDTSLSAERTFIRLDYRPLDVRGWVARMRQQLESGRI